MTMFMEYRIKVIYYQYHILSMALTLSLEIYILSSFELFPWTSARHKQIRNTLNREVNICIATDV